MCCSFPRIVYSVVMKANWYKLPPNQHTECPLIHQILLTLTSPFGILSRIGRPRKEMSRWMRSDEWIWSLNMLFEGQFMWKIQKIFFTRFKKFFNYFKNSHKICQTFSKFVINFLQNFSKLHYIFSNLSQITFL